MGDVGTLYEVDGEKWSIMKLSEKAFAQAVAGHFRPQRLGGWERGGLQPAPPTLLHPSLPSSLPTQQTQLVALAVSIDELPTFFW